MATPYLVASYQTNEDNLSNSPLISPLFTPSNGELLIVKASSDNDGSPAIGAASGGGLTYVSQVNITAVGRCPLRIFSAVVTGSPGSMAVTVAFSGGSGRHAIVVERWANAQVAGTPAVASNFSSGTPSLTIDTVASGSVVSWVNADWAANPPGTPVYLSGAIQIGIHDVSPGSYVAYFAYQNTDTAGTQTFGLSSPGGQNATLAAIELQGVNDIVVVDTVGPDASGSASFTSSLSWDHACTGRDRFLIVGVALGAGPDTGKTFSVTFNGISMTSAALVHTNNQSSGYIQLFYLVAPTSGTHTVAVTASTAVDIIGGSISFVGVDQTSPTSGLVTNFGDSASPAVTVTSKSGDMVVTTVAAGSGISNSNQTTRWLNNFSVGTGASNAAQATAMGASSINTTYTISSDWWGIIGLNLLAVGTSAPSGATATIAWLSM